MSLRTDSLVYLREFQASLGCIVRLCLKKKIMIAIINKRNTLEESWECSSGVEVIINDPKTLGTKTTWKQDSHTISELPNHRSPLPTRH